MPALQFHDNVLVHSRLRDRPDRRVPGPPLLHVHAPPHRGRLPTYDPGLAAQCLVRAAACPPAALPSGCHRLPCCSIALPSAFATYTAFTTFTIPSLPSPSLIAATVTLPHRSYLTLPHRSYLTLLEKYLLASVLMVFVVALESAMLKGFHDFSSQPASGHADGAPLATPMALTTPIALPQPGRHTNGATSVCTPKGRLPCLTALRSWPMSNARAFSRCRAKATSTDS